MSVGDKRREGHPAREGGQAHEKRGTVPSHQGGKESRPQGKDHALDSQQTLPMLQQTYTEKHTCSHTQTGTQPTHTRAGTQMHTQAFLWWTPEQASCQVNLCLSSHGQQDDALPDWGRGGDQLHPWEHQLLQVRAGQQVPRQQLCGHREPPDSGDQE